MYHLCTTAIFPAIHHKRKTLDIRLNIKGFSSVGVTGFEPATTRPSGEGLYSRRHPTVRESPSEIAAAAGSRTAPSQPSAAVANPTPPQTPPSELNFTFSNKFNELYSSVFHTHSKSCSLPLSGVVTISRVPLVYHAPSAYPIKIEK